MTEPQPEELLQMDVTADGSWSRILHRVVRSMHDGHCPHCGYLADALRFEARPLQAEFGAKVCPRCCFSISLEDSTEALHAFSRYTRRSVIVFEKWRELKHLPMVELNKQMNDFIKSLDEQQPSTGNCNGQESIKDSGKGSSEEDTEEGRKEVRHPVGWDLPA